MSVIIRLNDTVFNNSNLPVIARLVPGAAFSYKPSVSNGIKDSSGSGDSLTASGDPEITTYGAKVGYDNYYASSTLDDSSELTMIGVVTPDVDGGNSVMRFYPFGCRDTDNNQGWAVKCNASGSFTAYAYTTTGTAVAISSTETYSSTEGTFVALRISEDEISIFVASEDGEISKVSSSYDFSDRQKNASQSINIGQGSLTASTETEEDIVCEATLYKFALSDDQIQKAYEYSSVYFNNHTDVTI